MQARLKSVSERIKHLHSELVNKGPPGVQQQQQQAAQPAAA